ncbi:MAG TPA: polysaccharide biosynthesis/export family protein [Candidatus Obscuribacterales bacterium]
MSFSLNAKTAPWLSVICLSAGGLLPWSSALALTAPLTLDEAPAPSAAWLEETVKVAAAVELIAPSAASTEAMAPAIADTDIVPNEDLRPLEIEADEPALEDEAAIEAEQPPEVEAIDPAAEADPDLLSPLPAATEPRTTPQNRPAVPPFAGDGSSTIDQFNNGLTGYVLGPGDQLDIVVIGIDDLERNRIILPDGTLILPLIGSVTAVGRTVETLELEITRRYSFYLVDPVVEVNLNTLRPVVVTVGGEVNRPGPVQLNSLSTFNTRITNNAQLTSSTTSPTLSTALVGAGGIKRSADLRDIRVQRQLPDGQRVDLTINLWETIFQGQGESSILLQDGDVVFVPEAPEGTPFGEQQVIARSSLAPETVTVRVIGEVRDPGEIEIPPDGSVSSALAIAGGYDLNTADLSQVALLRLQDNGQVEEQIIDINANLVDATPIQDGDMIVVPKRGYLNTLDTISRALGPITAPFNFLLLLDRFFQSGN